MLFAAVMRWLVHSITDTFGITATVIFGVVWIGAMLYISRRIDIADARAARSSDYTPAPKRTLDLIENQRPPAD